VEGKHPNSQGESAADTGLSEHQEKTAVRAAIVPEEEFQPIFHLPGTVFGYDRSPRDPLPDGSEHLTRASGRLHDTRYSSRASSLPPASRQHHAGSRGLCTSG
jgi:hypothetical protein